MIPFLLFFACALLALVGAGALIIAREPVHSALSLVVVMVALAVLYLLLGAPFVAAVQILVYAGAIMVLFVFVIMLLNAGQEERTNFSKLAWIGMPLAALLGLEIAHWLLRSEPGATIANSPMGTPPAVDTASLSTFLFTNYLYPFEATSILILIAVLGAFALTRKDQ